MKKAVPIAVIMTAIGVYVYFFHIVPSRNVDSTVRGFGTVEAEEIIISQKIAARIEKIAAEEGDEVAAGQVLVTLHCEELRARQSQAEAQIQATEVAVAQAGVTKKQAAAARKQAEANLGPYMVNKKKAELELNRALTLRAGDIIPQKALDDAQAEVDAVKERIIAAEQGVTVSDQGVRVARQAIDLAESNVALAKASAEVIAAQLAECTLSSPRAGVVVRKNYHSGELVLPGAAIMKIVDMNDIFTWIYVPNEEIGKVRIGQVAEVIADTYPGQTFAGRVVRINEEAEFTPKSIQTKEDRTQLVYGVKVALENRERRLLPGMPVEASLAEDSEVETNPAIGEEKK